MQCCLAVQVLRQVAMEARPEERQVVLTMAQTFLIQDWMKPRNYCCTKVIPPTLMFMVIGCILPCVNVSNASLGTVFGCVHLSDVIVHVSYSQQHNIHVG